MLVVIGCALMAACGQRAGVYAAPPQKSLDLGPDPGGLKSFITMDEPISDDYIVRDISTDRGFRRWAFAHPELKFRVRDASHLKLVVELTTPAVTFNVTGPVTVSYAVNGQTLGTLRCDHAGDHRIEKAVPDGLVEAGKEIHVTFEAAPKWVSPEDGAQLSFMLHGAGFNQ
jgi:hypothetical protein